MQSLLLSVKNTDSAENKGYDAGKKVSGSDSQWHPGVAAWCHRQCHRRAGALAMLKQAQILVGGLYREALTMLRSLGGSGERNEGFTPSWFFRSDGW